jgi:hypothetical protein
MTGSSKKIKEIHAKPGTTLMEYITMINCCFPEETVRYTKHQGYFCDGTRRNAVPEALSQKDASWNGVPDPFFFLPLI